MTPALSQAVRLLTAALLVLACTKSNPLFVRPGPDDAAGGPELDAGAQPGGSLPDAAPGTPTPDGPSMGAPDGAALGDAPVVPGDGPPPADTSSPPPDVADPADTRAPGPDAPAPAPDAAVALDATPDLSPDAPLAHGLLGEYFAGRAFDGARLHARTDQEINFLWKDASPVPGVVPADDFCVRWTGKVQPLHSETYTFITRTDDGVRLYVNGVRLINFWDVQSGTPRSGSIALSAGQLYDLEMHYFDQSFTATARLSWSSPSQPEEIVPYDRLWH